MDVSPLVELLQVLLLTLSAAASALWIGLARRGADERVQVPLFCTLLAFVLFAGAGACGVAQLGFGMDTLEARRWLQQAGQLLGLPLTGLAGLALARRWYWSRPTWGRLVLGLCVLFQFARMFGQSASYALGIVLASALLVFYAGVLGLSAGRFAAAGLGAGALLLASLPLAGNPLGTWQSLLLTLACPLLATLIAGLAGRARQPTGRTVEEK